MPHEYGSGIELDLYWVQIHLIVELLFTYLKYFELYKSGIRSKQYPNTGLLFMSDDLF
jgi:hypothetical protein